MFPYCSDKNNYLKSPPLYNVCISCRYMSSIFLFFLRNDFHSMHYFPPRSDYSYIFFHIFYGPLVRLIFDSLGPALTPESFIPWGFSFSTSQAACFSFAPLLCVSTSIKNIDLQLSKPAMYPSSHRLSVSPSKNTQHVISICMRILLQNPCHN